MTTSVAGSRSVEDSAALYRDVRAIAGAVGIDAVGVTSAAPFLDTRRDLENRRAAGLHGGMAFTYRNPTRSTTPADHLAGARSLVVAARRYATGGRDAARAPSGPRPEPGRASGRVARYAQADHYLRLRRGLGAVADRIEADGWRTVVLCDDNALVDRAAAHRAGLGWFGKNANLLLPGKGSWFVLGSVLTDAPLDPSPRVVDDGCGSCHRCVDSCPTGAIVGPGVVDARRCLAWLVQAPGRFPIAYREALGDRLYGCDECQEVCPPTRTGVDPEIAIDTDAQPGQWVDLLDLLAAGDAELLDRFGRWYIPGRDPAVLRRNALVVLGNVADPRWPGVREALVEALAHPHELVRGHAAWAAARLGYLAEAERALVDERDPEVLDELARARTVGPR